MLQANELRIGNWFERTDPYSGYAQIHNVGENLYCRHGKGCTYHYLHQLKPIPLTPEILEKCGFEKRITIGHSVEYFIGENPITHDWMLKLIWQNSRDYPFYRNGHHLIKYLHQLQNLYFALTGEELTFKL
jgi:hypothetical protein